MEVQAYRKNNTTELFRKLDKVIFFCSGMNFWVDDNGVPELLFKAYQTYSSVVNVAVVLFMFAEAGSFFTQHDLTEKQQSDRLLMTTSHFILYSFTLSFIHHKETVTKILFTLAVDLKKDFNDEGTEKLMLKRTRIYVTALIVLCFNALVFYGIDGLIQVLFSDGTFVTIVTVWPEVHDPRPLAEAARIVIYILWWLWMLRVTTVYLLVLTITISLSHQHTNLQLYFKSLANIFEERISQREKELKFERAFKVGTRLHATTIWCAQQVQKSCGLMFSGHIIVNVMVLVLLMSQMKNADRTLSNVLPIVSTACSMLFSTGVIMWNAGDVTIEAGQISTAIFQSGWHNCTHVASYRIRRLLLIAITQSQKPVVIKSCGVIEMSYQAYLSIVKTSYSIFSVLY
uniref:Odorant receptor n=1 Tax=Lobesia botrana TaxID=209534 RepID=A0A345BEY1_9NEOP|nr:odorant receptors OR66 [Lobesia botrana]